ncbi:hypothetical protein IV38_GL000533 [Lactobacillus selangorensis]|uniref:Small ribosomal subunit biogenesis GTPase RsgA n=1 Tax=Lactobacillus selangorensis TaxID=81857 RepID=A0A0R2FNA7_9LACO|nr:ribosome small subunit-dependent GTPase A [Lactobacillus selangorensis]KRN29646.1 hypothetical protein IV38_GL000533 [Lactobacillus selangorensis]KRN33825.1 hypothetical protein IV40_GL000135 [Lactobacillus selangorensis]
MQKGQIIRAISGFYDLASDGNVYRTRGRGNFRKRGIKPLVGDWGEFESSSETEGYLLNILPRENELVRPPVANVDQAVIVTSCVEPQFSANLLDRFLVYLESKGIKAVIYLTKTDLASEQQLAELKTISDYYRSIGYPVVMPEQVFDQASLEQLEATFKQQLTIFTGQSGAGKSTLLNHIAPDLHLKTAAISQSLNRGKHTTRHVELIPLAGGLVADTPGFSSLSILKIPLTELPNDFPDFVAAAPYCKFRSCLHVKEPDCEVKRRVDDGRILKSRYTDYLQFRGEIMQQKPTYSHKE